MGNSFAPGHSAKVPSTSLKSARTRRARVNGNVKLAARHWSARHGDWLFLKACSLGERRGGRSLRRESSIGQVAPAGRPIGRTERSPRGVAVSREGSPYLPAGKVVGVESAQMGWFNANLGARRTYYHRDYYIGPKTGIRGKSAVATTMLRDPPARVSAKQRNDQRN